VIEHGRAHAASRGGRPSRIAAIDLRLDSWIEDPTIRVSHRRTSRADASALWRAAQSITLRDAQLLGRLVRWRIPGTPADISFDELFRRAPFTLLHEGETHLLSGIAGRIWTLRRDYPVLHGPDAFRAYATSGTVRVLFASWAEDLPDGGGALCSEVRVEAFGRQGRLGLATVRPIVRGFHQLIGSDGIAAAVRRADPGAPLMQPCGPSNCPAAQGRPSQEPATCRPCAAPGAGGCRPRRTGCTACPSCP
jgi:hypothetical protein